VRLYLRLIAIQLRAQLEYRLSFVFDLVTTGLVNGVYFLTLAAVMSRFGSIGGWQLGDVAFLFGLVEAAFATMDMLFSGFDPDVFSQHVRRGTFDLMLLRPLSLPLQVFTSEFVLRRLGRIVQGVIVLGLGLSLANVVWSPAKLVYLLVVFLSTVAFFGGLFVIGAALCFWTVQSLEVINIFTYGGSELLAYPMHIYGDWLRRFFTFVVPGALVTYYPALYLLDKPDPLGFPAIMRFLAPVAGGGVLALAFAFWQLGVRRYTSTGS
jgi:ABC-2 type transport system permease protein